MAYRKNWHHYRRIKSIHHRKDEYIDEDQPVSQIGRPLLLFGRRLCLEQMESALLRRDGRYIVDTISEIESCLRLIAKGILRYLWMSHLFVKGTD